MRVLPITLAVLGFAISAAQSYLSPSTIDGRQSRDNHDLNVQSYDSHMSMLSQRALLDALAMRYEMWERGLEYQTVITEVPGQRFSVNCYPDATLKQALQKLKAKGYSGSTGPFYDHYGAALDFDKTLEELPAHSGGTISLYPSPELAPFYNPETA